MGHLLFCTAACFLFCNVEKISAAGQEVDKPEVRSVRRYGDQAQHNAFTDLIRFDGGCCVSGGGGHVYGRDGQIRVIWSKDGEQWESAALLSEKGVDLRIRKISRMPDGRLMIVMGGSVYDGQTFGAPKPRGVLEGRADLDGVSEGAFAGAMAVAGDMARGQGLRVTYESGRRVIGHNCFGRAADGLRWEQVTMLHVPGQAGETTLRFLGDGRMMAFVRRRRQLLCVGGDDAAPYTEWQWRETSHRVGGPNFIVLPDGQMWAAGQLHRWDEDYGGAAE